jgi:hypothetical protein
MKTLKDKLGGYKATGINVPCKIVYEDVKKAVLEFEKEMNIAGDFSDYTRKKFKEIFGDFEEQEEK